MQETAPLRVRSNRAVPIRRIARVILALSFAPAGLFAENPLTLQVSSETVPPGASVQIKVFLTALAPVGSGSIAMDLDPAVFGDIAGISVFSANGDAMGYANVSGQHVDAHFTSPSSGIGLLPGLPVFTVSAPVLAGAAPGAATAVTVDPTGSAWQDAQGNPYAVTVNPAQFVAGGSLTVGNVTPGGGLLPPGAFLRVTGTGFDDATTVQIDGVSVFSVAFASAQELDVMLGAPTEMTGKHVRVVNGSGSQADYYCSLPSAASNSPLPFPGVHPIMPLRAFVGDSPPNNHTQRADDGIALLNQNVTPVNVTILSSSIDGFSSNRFEETVTIPGSALYFVNSEAGIVGYGGGTGIAASAPVRMLEFVFASPVTFSSPRPGPVFSVSPPNFSSWSLQTDSPAPAPASVNIGGSANFLVSITDGPWLTVSAPLGRAPATLTFTPDVSGLSPGIYNATVTITPDPGGSIFAVTIDFTVTVTAGPPGGTSIGTSTTVAPPRVSTPAAPLSVSPANISWSWQPGTPAPAPVMIDVNGRGSFNAFPGASWLTLSSLVGTAPTTLILTPNVSALRPGTYAATATFIPLPPNSAPFATSTITLTVTLAATGSSTLIVTPASLSIVATPGIAQSPSFTVDSAGLYTPFAVSISDPQHVLYLTSFPQVPPSSAFFTPQVLTVTATANQPGTYYGSIVVTTSTNSITVPVTLYVTATPTVPPLVSAIVDAASGLPGPLSPGETIAIYGSGIGSAPIGPTDASANIVSDFQGTQVLIDGIPATLVYASVGQVNAIIPDEVGTQQAIATVQVTWKGLKTNVWGVPVASPSPATTIQ